VSLVRGGVAAEGGGDSATRTGEGEGAERAAEGGRGLRREERWPRITPLVAHLMYQADVRTNVHWIPPARELKWRTGQEQKSCGWLPASGDGGGKAARTETEGMAGKKRENVRVCFSVPTVWCACEV
jgi:hypothetical protein